MEIGDRVKIRPFADIKPLLEDQKVAVSRRTGNIFNWTMKSLCETEAVVKLKTRDTVFLDCGCWWDNEWVTVIEPTIWHTGTTSEKSFNLAILRQAQSGNKPSISTLLSHNVLFPTKNNGGFNYGDFHNDSWMGREALRLPNWKWLNLRPEIVEEILEYMRISGEPFDNIERYPDNLILWFTFPKDKIAYYQSIQKELDKLDYKPNNTKKDETELQSKETPVRRDSEQTANRICYRKSKAQFVIRHISHQGSPFRC